MPALYSSSGEPRADADGRIGALRFAPSIGKIAIHCDSPIRCDFSHVPAWCRSGGGLGLLRQVQDGDRNLRHVVFAGLFAVTAGISACAPAPPPSTGAAFQPARGAPREAWSTECRADRFTDRNACTIRVGFGSGTAVGSLWSPDAGRTWMITMAPTPVAFRLRAGQNPPVQGVCRAGASSCEIANPQALTAQLRQAASLAVQVTGLRAQIDRDVSMDGFAEALARAEAAMPARPAVTRRGS